MQIRRASVSICSNAAEGCGGRGDRKVRRFLDVAMGSACELECELIIARDLAFIAESVREQALTVLIEIKRMLIGLTGSSPRADDNFGTPQWAAITRP